MSAGLWRVWEETVADAPHAPALVDAGTGQPVSRRELLRAAEALAPRLTRAIAGRTIAFSEPNGPGWFRVFLAIQKVGAIALPLDAGLPWDRRADAARELGAPSLVESDTARSLGAPTAEQPGITPDVCLLKLTSGTTALPRPLPFTAAQMLADGRQICAGMGIRPDDVNFGAIPFGHSYGLGNLVMPLVGQGTTVAYSVETLPGGLADGLARTGATVLPTVPTVLRALTESSAVEPRPLATLRLIISAGAFLRPDVATVFYEKFTRIPHNFYGSSETGGICFDDEGQATLVGRSVGVPLPSVRVELAAGADTRVRVTSPAVTDPGTHLLADRGEWVPGGELRLLGRAGAVANVGGRKADPADVERVLRGLPDVADAWVGVRTRPSGDDYLIAAVETRLSRERLLTLLSTRLPPWQVPRHVLTVGALPRTNRGKLDRVNLEARFG